MAISNTDAILNTLKVYYDKGKVRNLFDRNSPLLKMLKFERVEGKSQNFPLVYSFGGAVSANALVAEQKAAQNYQAEEVSVEPGKKFSIFSYTLPEVQAAKTRKGAYMKVTGLKAFAATEAFRKSLAASVYGSGFDEFGVVQTAITSPSTSTVTKIELPHSSIMAVGVNLDIEFKATPSSATVINTATVVSKDVDGINVVFANTTDVPAGSIMCFKGAMDASGNSRGVMGLGGWLPIVGGRSGSDWTNYISQDFYGAKRSADTAAMAGQFYAAASGEKKSLSVIKLLQRLRDAGADPDLIVMSPKDWLEFSQEIDTNNTYFTQTSTKAKREANVGYDKLSASFSTNYVGNIIDDPACPEGKFYVLEKDTVEFWTYTGTEKVVDDGVEGNNPGVEDPENFEDDGHENDSYKLVVDDFLTIEPAGLTADGSSVRCIINFLGGLVVTNPAHNGVGIFADVDTSTLLGYTY